MSSRSSLRTTRYSPRACAAARLIFAAKLKPPPARAVLDEPHRTRGAAFDLAERAGIHLGVVADDVLGVPVARRRLGALDEAQDERPGRAAPDRGGLARRDEEAHERLARKPPADAVRALVRAVLDDRVDPQAVALLLDRPPPRLVGVRLRLWRLRRRLRVRAPVVEELGHVHDRPGPLGDAQHEVVVLAPLERFPEAAHVPDERGAQDAEMAGVHLVAEAFRAPVRLEERVTVEPEAVDGEELVLVGVEVVGLRRRGDRLRHPRQRDRRERVVVVEQGDEVACSGVHPELRGRRDPERPLGSDHAVPGVGTGAAPDQLPHLRPVVVVDHEQLPPLERLGLDGRETFLEVLDRRPEDRGDDREHRRAQAGHAPPPCARGAVCRRRLDHRRPPAASADAVSAQASFTAIANATPASTSSVRFEARCAR